MSNQSSDDVSRRGVVGTLLMLPIGIIIVLLLLLYFFAYGWRGYFPGEFLLIFVILFFGLFVIRASYWSSRRKKWRERYRANEPVRILRQRYARGEITREQFGQMLRDLKER